MEDDRNIVIYGLLGLVAICIIVAVGYGLNIYLIAPLSRQNQLVDPSRTINLRQDFHNKLTEVITADSNIIALAQKITNNEAHVQNYDQSSGYQDDQTQLTNLSTIRGNAISGYNEQAQGLDTRQWNDICMPHSIVNTTPDQMHLDTLITQLSQEKQALTAKDGIC